MGVVTDILKGVPNILADPQGKKYHGDFSADGDRARKASYEERPRKNDIVETTS